MLLGENIDNLHEMFSIDVQYQVPRYQRRYVWDETNWEALWEDICDQLDPGLEDNNRGHFTGNIVIRSIKERQLDRYEVIDGQQRLATFQIIFCVIRDMCKTNNYLELAGEAARHIVNTDDVARRNDLTEFPYKFLPADYDKSAFQAAASGKYSEAKGQLFPEKEKDNHSILEAYDYFERMITAYAGTDCNRDKIGNLITTLKSDVQLIQITIASSNQSEKIFESLNATGKMLSEFDYLRNNLFLRLGEKIDGNGRFYRDIFYEVYWHFEDNSHYWDTETLESFFEAFLMAKLGPARVEVKNVKPFGLYREYRKKLADKQKFENEIQQLEYEFRQLHDYAKSYKDLKDDMNEPTSEIGIHMRFYEVLNIPDLSSFMLFIKHSFSNELTSVYAILESYIVRRLFCFGGKKDSYVNINKISYKKIKELFSQASEHNEFSTRELAEFLFEQWPNDEQVTEAFKQSESKDPDFISYIFRQMRDWKQEEAALYGEYAPLDLEAQVTHLSNIQEILKGIREDELKFRDLIRVFNDIWAPPQFFL